MKKRKQGRKIYGKSAQYWPVEMQPFVVAAACVQIVLENSEKASLIYTEAKEAWGRKDCQKALSEVKIPFSSMLAAVDAVVSNKMADYSNPMYDIIEQYKDSEDFKYLISRINNFIKVGFNSESDQAKGRYKVTPSKDNWLFYAVFIGTVVDFSEERADWDTYKLVEFGGKVYDPTTFMDPEKSNRKHRRKVYRYKKFNWRLRHDQKIRDIAWHWYQCRVIYAGPTEFCQSRDFISEDTPDPNDIDKEIRDCDLAVGYPRGN